MEEAYFLTSSEKPTQGKRPLNKNLGITINVESVHNCEEEDNCIRETWLPKYPEGLRIETDKNKHKIHWHIKEGSKWQDDNKEYEFM